MVAYPERSCPKESLWISFRFIQNLWMGIFVVVLYAMGLVYSEITLSNPVLRKLQPLRVRCLADTGSTYLVIPQHVATQL